MNPYTLLSIYVPKKPWDAKQIGLDLTELTREAGLVPHVDPAHGPLKLTGKSWSSEELHAEVRRRTFSTMQAEGWHYDGDTTPDSKPDCVMALWASKTPTEIMFEGKIFVPEPFDVILFRNIAVKHRRPANCEKKRWVFRQRLAPADWVKP